MTRQETFARGLSRRSFIKTATAAAAATTVRASPSHAAKADPAALIDTNVSLSQWPFRQTTHTTSELVAALRRQGVTQAWAGSLDALLHKDIASVNSRLAEQCQRHGEGLLIPIGALNPMLPGWEEDLRRCDEVHHMPGIRLHPNYHRYKLSDPLFERVLQLVNERNLLVQISVIMEDERTIHPLVEVPPTDTAPMSTVLKKFPKLRLQLLNAFRTLHGDQVSSLAALGVRFDIAMLEGVIGVERLLQQVPLTHVCFGSYAPVFYFDSTKLKLQESVLAGFQMKCLCSENALQLLSRM